MREQHAPRNTGLNEVIYPCPWPQAIPLEPEHQLILDRFAPHPSRPSEPLSSRLCSRIGGAGLAVATVVRTQVCQRLARARNEMPHARLRHPASMQAVMAHLFEH